ncbi:LCP family protein [Chloroflexus sp.]|uniref:LCP family protein n=1 Tax=Chloroflexus sp. TaxID=1904827 RepID=UPI00262DE6C9|nr:LCP family protein [uncultured Chloroflexus sp.]
MDRYGDERQQRARLSARERVEYLRAKRRQRWRRIVATGGIALALLLAAWSVVSLWNATVAGLRLDDPRQSNRSAPANTIFRQPFTVLFLGIDRRADGAEGVRSDTLMLAYVHPVERWVSLLSIPRDTVAVIRGLGEQKINAAYSYGYRNAVELYGRGVDPAAAGGALAAETVSTLLNLPVDYVVQIDFAGFERLIDAIGGLVIDVPYPLLDSSFPTEDYGYERILIPAGLQVFDGATALRYARSRHGSSDFDRARRQQEILRAALATIRMRGLLDQAGAVSALLAEAQRSIKTTLPIDDPAALRELIDLARMIDTDRVATFSINPRNVAVVAEIGSDIYWNRRDLMALVDRVRAGPRLDRESANVQVLNGTPVNGLAARVSRALESVGFRTLPPGNTERRATTMLIDYTGQSTALARLAAHLGLPATQVFATPPPDAPPQPLGADIVLVLGQDYNPQWALAP